MPLNEDLFSDFEDTPQQQPLAQPRISNRRRAIQQKKNSSAFDDTDFFGTKNNNSNPKKKHEASTPETIKLKPQKELKEPGTSLLDRIKIYFSNYSAAEIATNLIIWISNNSVLFALVAVIMIAVGLMVSRYISFGAAIVFLFLGWAINFNRQTEDTFIFYVYALAVFIIPYMF